MEKAWHPTSVLLPRKSHGQRSLVGCSPWGRWGSDTAERLHFHFLLSCFGEGNGNPPQCSCLENPRNGGAWWAAIYGVTQSWTRLKQLSSSSSRRSYVFILEKEPFCVTDGVCPLYWQANSYPLYYQGSPRSCICDTICQCDQQNLPVAKKNQARYICSLACMTDSVLWHHWLRWGWQECAWVREIEEICLDGLNQRCLMRHPSENVQ